MTLGKFLVSLTRVSDGITLVFPEDFTIHENSAHLWPGEKDWEGTVLYLWSEGNYSCNCNRFLFFNRALGKTEAEIDALDPVKEGETGDCGNYEKFICNWIKNADTGDIIYSGDRND